MRGTMTVRGGAALAVLLTLGGAASAQTAGSMRREQATTPASPASGGASAPERGETVKGDGPYNNQTKKLSNPLGANGK